MEWIELCGARFGNLTPAAESFLREWERDTDFIVAHTSGSTGKPKEVCLPKADMRLSARNTNMRFGIDGTSLLVCPLSVGYIAGKMMVVRALEAGCSLMFEEPSNEPLKHDYGTVALLPVVPSQCASLISNPCSAGVRNVIVGGAPLSADMETRMSECRFDAYATYGMTETCSHVAVRQLGHGTFTAMPGIRFETDSRDCLRILAPDYSFGELQTNDIVRLVSPVEFVWVGRYDNVINSGGVKIFPEEVEKLLAPVMETPFYVKGVADGKWGETVAMVAERDGKKTEAELMAVCRRVLPPYWVPKKIFFVDHLPLTANGKLDRQRAIEPV